jgi:hypothetical protein
LNRKAGFCLPAFIKTNQAKQIFKNKKMKNSIKVLIAITIISLHALGLKAQSTKGTTGIYMTEQDYKLNKLSYVLGENDKLRLNEFLDGKNISLNYHGKKLTLAKNEIFGYRMHNHDFRFFQNEAYTIIDTAGFTIYGRDKLAQSVKGSKVHHVYFFSINLTQPVLDLTIANLSDSFPTRTSFRYDVQNNFKQDTDLMAYDKFTGLYIIKYLFFQGNRTMAHAIL